MTGITRLLASYVGMDTAGAGVLSSRRYRDAVVSIHRPRVDPWQWSRRGAETPDVLAVVLLLDGTVTASGGPDPAEPATSVLVHGARDTRLTFSNGATCAISWMPAEVIEAQGVSLDSLASTLSRTALTAAMRGFVGSIIRQPAQSPVGVYVIERLLAEMTFGLVIEANETLLTPRSMPSLRDRAHALMLLKRTDPAYGPATIAGELGVSTRHLQRAFAQAGTSPMTVLRGARLQHAQSLLADPDDGTRSVAQIARESGFGSTATMRRAFHASGTRWPTRRRLPAAAIAERVTV